MGKVYQRRACSRSKSTWLTNEKLPKRITREVQWFQLKCEFEQWSSRAESTTGVEGYLMMQMMHMQVMQVSR